MDSLALSGTAPCSASLQSHLFSSVSLLGTVSSLFSSQAGLFGTSRSKTITAWLEAARKAPSVNPLAEEDSVAQALIEAGGNVSTAARRLGMPRGALRYWIQEDGLEELVEELRS